METIPATIYLNFNEFYRAEGKEDSEEGRKSLKAASIFFTVAVHILREVAD